MDGTMRLPLFVVGLLLSLLQGYESQQIQMPEAGAFHLEEDLGGQVLSLQKNVSELWTYIYQLRTAVTTHLNHLRQHQLELENTVHGLTHHGDSQSHAAHSHSDDHHSHSDDHHSHGEDHHSHGEDHHSHGEDHHHSHGEDHHSHADDHHHHSGEQHSHDDGQHSHSGEHHDSSGHHHEVHSHTDDAHGAASHANHEDHHDDHKDSHEKEEDLQQVQQGASPEPVVTPARRQPHSGNTPGGYSHGSHVASPSGNFKPLPLMHHHHHHHHDNQPDRNRSRVVVIPKYTEYDLYEFAVCNVQPNRAIPEDQQQEVTGQVSLWQKKIGGPLNIHVSLRGFNMGDHHGAHQALQQEQNNETPDTSAGHKHGFHVHALSDLTNGCNSAGPHYNPKSATHAGPNALVRHVGDLGNIECDDHGVANIVFTDEVASLTGQHSIVGKTIVIHSQPDDLGLGGNEESLRTGNAGTRIACCVLQKVEKLPIRLYRAIKTATQYQNY